MLSLLGCLYPTLWCLLAWRVSCPDFQHSHALPERWGAFSMPAWSWCEGWLASCWYYVSASLRCRLLSAGVRAFRSKFHLWGAASAFPRVAGFFGGRSTWPIYCQTPCQHVPCIPGLFWDLCARHSVAFCASRICISAWRFPQPTSPVAFRTSAGVCVCSHN